MSHLRLVPDIVDDEPTEPATPSSAERIAAAAHTRMLEESLRQWCCACLDIANAVGARVDGVIDPATIADRIIQKVRKS